MRWFSPTIGNRQQPIPTLARPFTPVAPFEQARSRTASPGFLKVLGLYLVAGLMLGVLPASFPVALILSALVVNNSAPTTGRRTLTLALCYVAGTVVANIPSVSSWCPTNGLPDSSRASAVAYSFCRDARSVRDPAIGG